MQNIIVATIKEWNILNFYKLQETYSDKYTFHLITNPQDLNLELVQELSPLYIFFPHWSWIIQKEIYQDYKCVVFHMSDLPFGRGGSPLQNLIMRELYETKISAIEVTQELDAGDIYLKEPFSLKDGSAQELFVALSEIIFTNMIPKFLNAKLIATPQKGKVVAFKRRKPQESDINNLTIKSISKLYDFIRMLDAEGYPQAYLELGESKILFSDVKKHDGKLTGKFEVVDNG